MNHRPTPQARSDDPDIWQEHLPILDDERLFIPVNPGEALFDQETWIAIGEMLHLSDRELCVAMLLMEGHSRAAIARRIHKPDGSQLSSETVRVYIERVFKKAKVHNKCELALRLIRIERLLE